VGPAQSGPAGIGALRVCFVAGTLGQGGAERQLYYILRTLKAQGAVTRVLSLDREAFWEEPIRQLGVEVRWVGRSPFKLVRLAAIVGELRRDPPHVIQSQHFFANLYASGAARALRVRDVGAIRGDGASERRANGAIPGRLSLRYPRHIAANSRAAISRAIECGVAADRLTLLPNVVDTDQFRPKERVPDSKVRLLAVGRWTPGKRFDRFAQVVTELKRQLTVPIEGVIVTSADRDPRAVAEWAGPDAAITFDGPHADLVPTYTAADLLVLTSDAEGTPNVLLEAMACGLPVVATSVGGVPDLVRHGETGFLVSPGDDRALVEAVKALVVDPHRRRDMGARARAFVEQHHAVPVLAPALEHLYSRVLRFNTAGAV
jgi:glycosyltransferase involved in cell wall biosynthesis